MTGFQTPLWLVVGPRVTLVTSSLQSPARIVALHGGSMDQDMEEQEQERVRKLFGFGRAGEPVSTVDPKDVKAVWERSVSLKERIRVGQAR